MSIEDVIAHTLTWAWPSDGDNLTGFHIDTEYAFESKEIFESVGVERTNDRTRLLVVRVVARNASRNDVAHALCEAWSELVYRGFQATAIHESAEGTTMRFVTATEDGALCVTGEVMVTDGR